MNLLRACLLCLTSLLLISCNSTSQSNVGDGNSLDSSSADKLALAKSRSARISEISYQLSLDLTQSEHFNGTTRITFKLSDTSTPLSLDLLRANIKSFVINGHKIYPRYNGKAVILSPSTLVSGSNTVDINYSQAYGTQGMGLVRFMDPKDGKVYLESNFCADHASMMFPLFSQADLKASYSLNVTVPKTWLVISSVKEQKVIDSLESNLWQFPSSPKLSPHMFSLHAGPYRVWKDDTAKSKYPIRLFSRQAIADDISPQIWFKDMDKGIRFMEEYLITPYPFSKFDMVLSPMMANDDAIASAAVASISENMTHHLAPLQQRQKTIIKTTMTNLTAQWFGALVTMNIWDESRLNMSLRSLITKKTLAHLGYKSLDSKHFYDPIKAKAYVDDLLFTYHSDTSILPSAGVHKSEAILQGLEQLIAEPDFRLGLQHYLTKFANKNVSAADFFASLSLDNKHDLTQWQQDWFTTPGVNTIKAEFTCKNNRVSEFSLLQSSASKQHPRLREQKITLALFTKGRNELHRVRSISLVYKGERTRVRQLNGTRCPDLVYPNYLDSGYVKVSLDKRSLKTVKQHLNMVTEPQLRSMLWQSLWESVSDGELALNKYLDVVFINLPKEKEPVILKQVLTNLNQSKTDLELILKNHSSYIHMALKGLEQMSLRKAMVNDENPNIQHLWFDAYIQFSHTPDSLTHLAKLLAGSSSIKGLKIDQEMRWKIVTQLNRYDYLGSRSLINKELNRDQSPRGRDAAIAAQVSRPEAGIKRYWLTHIQHDTNMPFSTLSIAMAHLYPREQKILNSASSEQRLESLAQLDASKSDRFMKLYGQYLLPTRCDHRGLALLKSTIDKQAGLSATTQKALLQTHQSELRCVAIKEHLLR
ncbi:ERAP1-like C-terminal domain-containing protein [Shewanella violacea]|uniref:Aminopeptidase N n=1 Tax=Shewanella violacea (strain JCM 10179 / CIP 106290 / LMG 19151 / DSS12) TaxID=637905 RepID=D4ZGC6_SHEVD|nr:ERAP1-like C-terminal domain-containing protein [Shewanella violacea]BAJ00725.1 aminopeptidase N [Shewanella violacea DSS12]